MWRIVSATLLCAFAHTATAEISTSVLYLKVARDEAPTLSNLDPIPADLGLAGARLGLADNQTTGRFLGQEFQLHEISLSADAIDDPRTIGAIATHDVVLIDAPAAVIGPLADLPAAAGKILFNVAAQDQVLRSASCRGNLFHTIPSYAMRADALTQFLVTKRWTKTALIAGPRATDQAFSAAIETSIRKFALKPGARVDWTFDADLRRSAAQEVPLLTQSLGKHDVLLIADEANDFARYVQYNTWLPRPVAGSVGLRPVAWAREVEQWGAAQLQSRFVDLAARPMQSEDYAAWAALRSIGEAMTRTQSDDIATLRAYILSPEFELAGFKGRPLSYRAWNGQLRQPIPLVAQGAVVASAPLEGFLHQRNELDTLGLDAPDSACTAFEE